MIPTQKSRWYSVTRVVCTWLRLKPSLHFAVLGKLFTLTPKSPLFSGFVPLLSGSKATKRGSFGGPGSFLVLFIFGFEGCKKSRASSVKGRVHQLCCQAGCFPFSFFCWLTRSPSSALLPLQPPGVSLRTRFYSWSIYFSNGSHKFTMSQRFGHEE